MAIKLRKAFDIFEGFFFFTGVGIEKIIPERPSQAGSLRVNSKEWV